MKKLLFTLALTLGFFASYAGGRQYELVLIEMAGPHAVTVPFIRFELVLIEGNFGFNHANVMYSVALDHNTYGDGVWIQSLQIADDDGIYAIPAQYVQWNANLGTYLVYGVSE